MKIVICTTPIRPVPTSYPPFGSMALIQSLRAAGYDTSFYDIDGLRPSFDEVVTKTIKLQTPLTDYRSLRRIVDEQAPVSVTLSERSMTPLRAGR